MGCVLRESLRVVLDFDGVNHENGKELAREFYEKYRRLFKEAPKNIVETPNGIHFHFRLDAEMKTRPILNEKGDKIGDLKATGHVTIPSVVSKPYRWLRRGRIQEFPRELFPETRKEVDKKVVIEKTAVVTGIKDIRSYIRAIKSVQGSHGSDSCFRVACILRDSGNVPRRRPE